MDTGNYRRVPATALSAIAWAALEMGDVELTERLIADAEATLEPVTERGVKRYARASTLSNSALLGAQVGNAGTHRQRVARGLPTAWAIGPVLDECSYPDVLVARAVSDGDDLQLVLRPGNGAGRQRLGIADLQPEQDYHLAGAVQSAVTADATGKASIDVDLDGRAEVRVTPRS